MPQLYYNTIHPADLEVTGKTLYQVLTDSRTPCIVHRITGTDITKVGYDLEHARKRGFGEKGEKGARSGRVEEEELAVNYVTIVDDSNPIIVDHNHNRHFRINPLERTVLVIAKDLPNIFYHARIAAGRGGNYLYEGTLLDALKEFQEMGFSFFGEIPNLESLFSEPIPK